MFACADQGGFRHHAVFPLCLRTSVCLELSVLRTSRCRFLPFATISRCWPSKAPRPSVPFPADNKGKPAGRPDSPGSGGGRDVTGADLPRLIYVRWQSLAEPQTYEAYIVIPESAREIMRKPEKAFCRLDGKWITDYRDRITIGLAPGGIAKVWQRGPCLKSVEIARVEGSIVKQGPYQGKNGGRYALPLSPESKTYIEKYGIPFGSW